VVLGGGGSRGRGRLGKSTGGASLGSKFTSTRTGETVNPVREQSIDEREIEWAARQSFFEIGGSYRRVSKSGALERWVGSNL